MHRLIVALMALCGGTTRRLRLKCCPAYWSSTSTLYATESQWYGLIGLLHLVISIGIHDRFSESRRSRRFHFCEIAVIRL
jgi:hypothetical protein